MTYKTKITSMRQELRELYKANPQATAGFTELSKAVKTESAIGLKEKEYVALGIAVATRCEPCINFHVEALMKTGATREELADVLGMALQMSGGPGLMYSAHALACWDELAQNDA